MTAKMLLGGLYYSWWLNGGKAIDFVKVTEVVNGDQISNTIQLK